MLEISEMLTADHPGHEAYDFWHICKKKGLIMTWLNSIVHPVRILSKSSIRI